jgi:hypothetical protein
MSTFDTASVWRKREAVLAILATAIGAIGLLTIPAPAPAHAACDQYAFPGGVFTILQYVPAGPNVEFKAPPNSQEVNGVDAIRYDYPGPAGYVNAQIVKEGSGITTIRIQFHWNDNLRKGVSDSYTGRVSDDGKVHDGSSSSDRPIGQDNPGRWSSVTQLVCYSSPAPTPPPSELKLEYGNPYFGGIPAFVSITNNDNKPPVGCLYRDGINSINFTVTGSAPTQINIPGIPTGTTFHVTVTCDNGLSSSQDKVF